MSQALMRREEESMSLQETLQLGQLLAESGFFQDSKGASQCVAKILAGRELGIGPIASMTNIYIVKGRITLSGVLIAAQIKKSERYNYKIIEHADDVCTIDFLENGQRLGTSRFTKTDAQQAGLLGSDNYRKYPRNMLFSRAMSNGAKWFTPDVFNGPVYTPDELGAPINDETGEIIEPEPRAPERPLQLAGRPSEVATTPAAEACEQTGSEEPKPQHQDRVAEMRAHRAKALAEAGCVEREEVGFTVKSLGVQGDLFRIWKDENGKALCNCSEFNQKIEQDPRFRCEHILAVKLFLDPESQPQASAEQPAAEPLRVGANGAIATTMADLVTPKQLVAMRAIANARSVDLDEVCRGHNNCLPQELSRKAATEFIDYLKNIYLVPEQTPTAKSLRDIITDAQIRGVRAMAEARGLNAQDECRIAHGCLVEELNRETAVNFLEYLKNRTPGSATIPTSSQPESKAETDRKALLDKARAMMDELGDMGHERFKDSKNRLIWIRNLAAQKWSIDVDPESITKPADLSDDLLAELVKELYAEGENYQRHIAESPDKRSI